MLIMHRKNKNFIFPLIIDYFVFVIYSKLGNSYCKKRSDGINKLFDIPRSKNTDRFRQESTGNHQNVEAVFPPEIFWIFFDDFQPVPAEKHGKFIGIHRKKSKKFPVGILLPRSGDFRCFPAGSGDFPASFCGIPRDPVAGIIDLGIYGFIQNMIVISL